MTVGEQNTKRQIHHLYSKLVTELREKLAARRLSRTNGYIKKSDLVTLAMDSYLVPCELFIAFQIELQKEIGAEVKCAKPWASLHS